MLERSERIELLQLARRTLEEVARSGKATRLSADALNGFSRPLRQQAGAFVSLHTHAGEIRGCVGCMVADRPLAEVIVEMTGAAALRDPRFPPVTSDETDGLEIEISVLGPMEEVSSLDEVEIGRHGLLASGHGRRGVLLPQVASERGWSADEFAAQTCVKAGLPADSYRAGQVELLRFAAEVFSESQTL